MSLSILNDNHQLLSDYGFYVKVTSKLTPIIWYLTRQLKPGCESIANPKLEVLVGSCLIVLLPWRLILRDIFWHFWKMRFWTWEVSCWASKILCKLIHSSGYATILVNDCRLLYCFPYWTKHDMFIAKWPAQLSGAVHHSLKSDCGRLPHWHPRLAHGTHPHDFLLEKGRLFALMHLEKGQTMNTILLEGKLDQILQHDRPRAMTWFHLRWVKESHK